MQTRRPRLYAVRDELIRRNVRQRIHITMQDAKRYYDANPLLYRTELRLRLRHLMLSAGEGAFTDQEQAVRARIEELRQEIVDGADFAALARTHSEAQARVKAATSAGSSPGICPIPWPRRPRLYRRARSARPSAPTWATIWSGPRTARAA